VNREGLSVLDDGSLQENAPLQLPFFWERLVVAGGQLLYINRVSGRIFSSWTEELEERRNRVYRGGVLADEMGLGKTVR
jgi:SNF2 family DNA or RNA helicase